MTWVKICGVRCPEDAVVAFEAGASAVGLMFAPESPRYLDLSEAKRIVAARGVTGSGQLVGVFVNADQKMVREYQRECGLDLIQLHGEESREYCESLKLPFLKVFRIRDQESLVPALNFPAGYTLLLDAYSKKQRGGLGESFSWDIARKLADAGRPFYLAGGLSAGNVREALQTSGASGVDCSSGVETDGRKDPEKIEKFVKAALGSV